MGKTILCRADDFGSARAVNKAILESVDKQYIVRNVSCIAVAPYIEEGAEYLRKYDHISVGLHAAITSEWQEVRWGPLTEEMQKSDLVAHDGCFYQTQMEVKSKNPDIGLILREYDAQLDKLCMLGLNVEYADIHMAPELWIEGLPDAFQEWTRKKGLLNAENYYEKKIPLPVLDSEDSSENLQHVEDWLKQMVMGNQYFYVLHPAVESEEMLRFCNQYFAKGIISQERAREYHVVTSEKWINWKRAFDLISIRYSEAEEQPGGRKVLEELIGYCAG